MRILLSVVVLTLLGSAPLRAPAEEPKRLELLVGEARPVGGFRPLCDDPSIAAFAADGSGGLKGLKPGETTCSVSMGSPLGPRTVYRVVVKAGRKGGDGPKGRGAGGA